MFGARKKFVEFVEVVDNDFADESMYYNQPSMFPHRSDKDVSFVSIFAHFCRLGDVFPLSHSVLSSNVFLQMLSSPSPSSSGQLSQLGASLYGPQSKCFIFVGVKRNYLWGTLANKTRVTESLHVGHSAEESSLGCLTVFVSSSLSFCRRARLLGKGHGEQYASVKPKFNARHAATKSYHPHNGSPDHVPPYPSITKQVCTKVFTCL